jgi:hypothetical protein
MGKTMKKVLIIIGLVTVVAACAWAFRAYSVWSVNARNSKFKEDIENLFAGLQQYKEHVGTYPSGSNAEIVRALKGQNPKNVIILVGRKNEVNAKGEFVDPWGTPLKIYFTESGVLVRSAGGNRRFDDSTAMECDDFFRSN